MVDDVTYDRAQSEAERELMTCRPCGRTDDIDKGISIWRNGKLIYAIGDCCLNRYVFVTRPTEKGIEIKGKIVSPIVVVP